MEDLIAEAVRAEGDEGDMVRLLIDIAAQAEDDVGLRTQAIKVSGQLVRRRCDALRPIDHASMSKGPIQDPPALAGPYALVATYLSLMKKLVAEPGDQTAQLAEVVRTLHDLLVAHTNPYDVYSLWDALEANIGDAFTGLLLQLLQGVLVTELDPAASIRRHVFVLHGPHAGIVAPAGALSSTKKGYSFATGILIEPGTPVMSLLSLRGSNGHGVTVLLDGDSLLLATHTSSGTFTKLVVPLPSRRHMEHHWTHFCLVHAKKMVFKDKISIYIDGALVYSGSLPYIDTAQLVDGHNCIGTMPHFPSFQGRLWLPTLFGTALSDAEVGQLHWRDGAPLLRAWLYENVGLPDKTRFVYAYDARACAIVARACFDVSRSNGDGWLEPGTVPVRTVSLPSAIMTLGGITAMLYGLVRDPTSTTEASALACLHTLIAGLRVSPRCRGHFVRTHGSKVVASMLHALPSLSLPMLHAIKELIDVLSTAVLSPRLRSIVLVLLVMNAAWYRAPLETQLALFSETLPAYRELLETAQGGDYTVVDVSYWCGVLRRWYATSTSLTLDEARLCCKLVLECHVEPRLFPKNPVATDPFLQLVVYLDDRLAHLTAADADVVEILRFLARGLGNGIKPSGPSSPPPMNRVLRQLLKWTPPCIWYKWLRTPLAAIRLLLLQTFETMMLTLPLRYADAVLLSASLQDQSLSVPDAEVLVDLCLGRLDANCSRSMPTPRFACVPVVLLKLLPTSSPSVQLYVLHAVAKALHGADMLLETIRSYPEWLAVLAAVDTDTLPSPPSSSRMDPDMLNDYCMVLVDDAASVSARIDMVRAIASSKDKVGADHLLTAFASPRTPMPVQDAIVHAVLAELPSHVSVVATRLRLRIVQIVLLYAARHVRHGWMHVLEALFYFPSPLHQLQVLLAIVQESVVMPYNAWENLSQVASIATVWAHRRLQLPNDQLQPLGKATMQLWALVAPHLNQVPWRDAAALLHLETPEMPGEALVHRLFAPLAIAQALAIEAVFTYATRQVDGVDVSVLQRTTDVILHPPLPDDDDKTTPESLRRARSLSIDMAWSARLQWRLLRGLVEWLETAPSPPLLKWLHTLARDPGYIATTPLLERLQSVELPMPCDLASAMTALDTSVDTNQHVYAFNALWDTHVASSSVFNAVLLVQDVDVRASLQQGHLDELAAVYETLWSDDDAVLLYPIADVLDRLRADVTAATEAFLQSSLCLRLLLQRKPLPAPTTHRRKLRRAENGLRMRLCLKPMNAMTSLPLDADIRASEPHHALDASWRSDGASFEELTDMLADANVRAVLRTATSSTIEDADDADDVSGYEGPSWESPPPSAEPARPTTTTTTTPRSAFSARVEQLSESVELLQDQLTEKVQGAKAALDMQVDHLRLVKDTLSEEARSVLATVVPKSRHDGTRSSNLHRRRSSLDASMKLFKAHDFVCKAQWICDAHIVAGDLRVTDRELLFVATAIVDEHGGAEMLGAESRRLGRKVHRLLLDDIKHVYGRRYLLKVTALELFVLSSRKNYLFHVCPPTSVHDLHRAMMTKRPAQLFRDPEWRRLRHPSHMFKTSAQTSAWVNHEISTFEYLMWLNTLAGRTYNDVTQYPVFPWVLADYTSRTLDLSRRETFRDLSKPLGALNPSRLSFYLERYNAFDDPDIPKFMYGSHYSHVGAVLYYLLRLEPFTTLAKRVQGGRLDHADRLFHSIAETWANCLSDTSDLKELTPEWFYQPAFLRNANGVDLGTCQNGTVLGDVVLPPYASSADDFVFQHMLALESEYVSAHLHEWIDLVFGAKQRGPAAVAAHNVFFYLTYEGSVDIDSIDDPVLQASMRAQIAHFGQTPTQLLKEPHPRRNLVPDASLAVVSPVLLPHMAPITVLEVLQSTLFCLDAAGFASVQQLRSPFQGPAQPTSASPARTLSPLSLSRTNSSACDASVVEVLERKPRRLLAADAWLSPIWTAVLEAGNFVVSGGHLDGSVRVYTANDGSFHSAILHHAERVTCIARAPRRYLVCGSADGTLSVWTLASASASPSVLLDFSLSMFRSTTKRAVVEPDWSPSAVLLGHRTPIVAVVVCDDLDVAVSCSDICLVHRLSSGSVVRQLPLPACMTRVRTVGISRLGIVVVAGSSNDDAHHCLSTFGADGTMLAQVTPAYATTRLVLLERTGHVIVSGPLGASVLAVHTLAVVQALTTVGVASVAVSVDEKYVVLGLDVMPVQLLTANLVLA